MSAEIQTREGLFKVMAQIAAEREAAKPLVEELLKRDEPPWDEEIPEEWKTAGFVDELTKAAAGILERDPSKSLAYLQIGLGLARSLDRYPEPLPTLAKLSAIKHLGYTHQFHGALHQAIRVLSCVEDRESLSSHLEYANIKFVLATVLMRARKLDAAMETLDHCEKVYDLFGDRAHYYRCQVVRATITCIRGDFENTIQRVTPLIVELKRVDDLHTLMVAHTLFGWASLAVGRAGEAFNQFTNTRQLAVTLAMPAEIDRADWNLCRVRIQTTGTNENDLDILLRDLEKIRASFLNREMVEDAGLVGLDMVDVLIALGRRDAARELAEQVMSELAHPGLEHQATQAMAYLREFLPSSERAREAVQRVRAYVARSRTDESTPLFVDTLDDPSRL